MDRQYVGIDFHRRRSVVVRMSATARSSRMFGWRTIRWRSRRPWREAGADPEVVVEATYGWYSVVDLLQASGARVHLRTPRG
jgi:hypothetical protein